MCPLRTMPTIIVVHDSNLLPAFGETRSLVAPVTPQRENHAQIKQKTPQPLGEAARRNGERAMLDFAVKLTAEPWSVAEEDRARLRQAGFSDRDIWDIAAVAGFFNMTNRVASATDMRPNSLYHGQAR